LAAEDDSGSPYYFSAMWEEKLNKLYIENSFFEDYGLVMCYVM